jgi:hypothetical protein
MCKEFNRLLKNDPICIQIATGFPIVSQSDKNAIKTLFQKVICMNKVGVVDIAYETISYCIDRNGISDLFEKQNIYICLNGWIRREFTESTGEISFAPYMNEMSEAFANNIVLRGDTFLSDIPDMGIDMSDWQIAYFDSIGSVRELL